MRTSEITVLQVFSVTVEMNVGHACMHACTLPKKTGPATYSM